MQQCKVIKNIDEVGIFSSDSNILTKVSEEHKKLIVKHLQNND